MRDYSSCDRLAEVDRFHPEHMTNFDHLIDIVHFRDLRLAVMVRHHS